MFRAWHSSAGDNGSEGIPQEKLLHLRWPKGVIVHCAVINEAPAPVEEVGFRRLARAKGAAADAGTASCENQAPLVASVLARIDENQAALDATRQKVVQLQKRCRSGSCGMGKKASAG